MLLEVRNTNSPLPQTLLRTLLVVICKWLPYKVMGLCSENFEILNNARMTKNALLKQVYTHPQKVLVEAISTGNCRVFIVLM